MSAPLPLALRTRFKRYIEEGLSGRAAAAQRPGNLAPHKGAFEDLLAQDPEITVLELRAALANAEGVSVPHSSIAALLTRPGFTYKKIVPNGHVNMPCRATGGHRAQTCCCEAGPPGLDYRAATGHPSHAGACRFHSFSTDCCAITCQAVDKPLSNLT